MNKVLAKILSPRAIAALALVTTILITTTPAYCQNMQRSKIKARNIGAVEASEYVMSVLYSGPMTLLFYSLCLGTVVMFSLKMTKPALYSGFFVTMLWLLREYADTLFSAGLILNPFYIFVIVIAVFAAKAISSFCLKKSGGDNFDEKLEKSKRKSEIGSDKKTAAIFTGSFKKEPLGSNPGKTSLTPSVSPTVNVRLTRPFR